MNAAPVNRAFDEGAGIQLDAFQGPFFIFFKTGAVNDVADVFFAAGCFTADVFFENSVGVIDNFDNGVFGKFSTESASADSFLQTFNLSDDVKIYL